MYECYDGTCKHFDSVASKLTDLVTDCTELSLDWCQKGHMHKMAVLALHHRNSNINDTPRTIIMIIQLNTQQTVMTIRSNKRRKVLQQTVLLHCQVLS